MDSTNWRTIRTTRMVDRVRTVRWNMATEEETTEKAPVDEVMDDIRRELVREL